RTPPAEAPEAGLAHPGSAPMAPDAAPRAHSDVWRGGRATPSSPSRTGARLRRHPTYAESSPRCAPNGYCARLRAEGGAVTNLSPPDPPGESPRALVFSSIQRIGFATDAT